MNEDKLIFGAKVLKHFVNNALGLDYEHYEIT